MKSIGVRELRQRASEYLRRVQAGETIEVTDRGRPVALLSPVPQGSILDRLRAAGELSEAGTGGLPDPVEPAAGTELPSERLASLRADER